MGEVDDMWCLQGANTKVKFRAPKLDMQLCETQHISFFAAFVEGSENNMMTLRYTDRTQVLPCLGSSFGLIDLCCGLGGMSQGASYSNLPTLVGMDFSAAACKTFARNHFCPIVHGNILDPFDLACAFAKAGQKSAIVSCGFPCPPFSSRGDAKGFDDARSEVFGAALDAAYIMKASMVILECTPLAGKSAQLRSMLDLFAKSMGFQVCDGLLHLDRLWPCMRTRWWCVLVPAGVPCPPDLPDLPCFAQFAKVSDVIPVWPQWTLQEENGLSFTEEEQQLYFSLADPQTFLLRASDRCPTLLHSMGHHAYACPCGCRRAGLCKTRLQRDGLSLTALPSRSQVDGFRHLHPAEAGHLCTLPPDFVFDTECIRHDLPLIGNIAAPVQMQWTLAFGLQAMQRAGLAPRTFDFSCPSLAILHTLQQNNQVRLQLWPTHLTSSPQVIDLILDGVLVQIKVSSCITVAQLLGWGTRVEISKDDQVLLPRALLQPGTYVVNTRKVRHALPAPTGPISVSFHWRDSEIEHVCSPGVFLADVMRAHDIPYSAGLSLCTDLQTFSWGDRLWESLRGNLRGGGPSCNGTDGLHATELFNELNDLVNSLSSWQRDEIWIINQFLMHSLLRRPQEAALRLLEMERPKSPPRWIIAPLLVRQHWVLFVFDLRTGIPTYFDSLPDFAIPEIAMMVSICQHVFHRAPAADFLCGTLVLHNFGLYFGLWKHIGYDALVSWHHSLLAHEELRGFGVSDYASAHDWLFKFLVTKGVAEGQVATRAAAALKKLGLGPISKAIASSNPWQALKQLANGQARPFQWVEHSELQAHIANKAKRTFGASSKPVKSKSKAKASSDPHVPLLPETIKLGVDAFTDAQNKPLTQLQLDQISPEARGIVITSLAQAQRFLQDQKRASVDALALLTTSEIPQPMHGALQVQHLTWPGLIDSDPLLIRGSCLQLGDVQVKKVLGKTAAPSALSPDLLRVMVYKDQWPLDWTLFAAGPLRALIQRFDALKYCDGADCGQKPACMKFHPSLEEEVELVILDAFQWRWTDHKGSLTSSAKSQVFSVLIRVPPSATDQILMISSTDGTYVELRSTTSPGSHPKFAVVWVKGDLQQALHLRCQTTKALHVVRFFEKYGLRCLAADHETVHKQFFPKDPFAACGRKLLFEVGPWPYGITKKAMMDALSADGWVARPVRPGRGSQHGRFWIFGSDVSPTSPFLTFGESSVTITKIQETIANRDQTNVVASLKTLQKISNSSQIDPLQISDPWAKPSTLSTASSSTAALPSRLSELEAQIRTSVKQQVNEQLEEYKHDQPSPMEISDDPRLSFLESNVAELKAQSEQFQSWFTEAGEKMGDLYAQVQKQQDSIAGLTETVGHAVGTAESVQAQVAQLRGEFRSDLESTLAQQTERLEALLSKKHRTE